MPKTKLNLGGANGRLKVIPYGRVFRRRKLRAGNKEVRDPRFFFKMR